MSVLKFLCSVNDLRGKQGRQYDLGNVLYICLLGLLSGANSYRKLHIFMRTHYPVFKEFLGLSWDRVPAYTTLRDIIHGMDIKSFEELFRHYSKNLVSSGQNRFIAADGKTLRGSFDNLCDQRAVQLFSIFALADNLILAHEEIPDKTNEIKAFQALIGKLGIKDHIFTLDALHTQKNT